MESTVVALTDNNCKVKCVSQRNNLMIDILEGDFKGSLVVINKKYFNQISAFGKVEGRIRHTEDGLLVFEGFSFR